MSTQRFNEKDGGDGLKEPLDALLHASLHRRDALQTESLRTGLNQRGRRASMRSFMELGNQAEFLGIMSRVEMLAQFFTHDGGDTSKWRLKGHGRERFWEWLASWSVCIRNPSDLGFDGSRYVLPPIHYHQHTVESDYTKEGDLFPSIAQTPSERRDAKRNSLSERVKLAVELTETDDDYWIIWCHLNDESSALKKALPDAVEVIGTLPSREKEDRILSFIRGEKKIVIGKPSIFGFGLNLQHCRNMIFVGMDDSYEMFYQSIRRCWRFRQDREVNVHIISSSSEGEILKNVERKKKQADEMSQAMVEHMREFSQKEIHGTHREVNEYRRETRSGDQWTLHLGDCVDVAREIPDNRIGYTIFSPPFASLYTYSNSPRDMGNCRNFSDFYAHFQFLVSELLRITMPGRLLSFHCMNLPTSKQHHGVIGLHDFRGELIRIFVEAGWIYHSEVVIWKDPVVAMQRTKAIGLLYKQLKKDSALSRQGVPDYLVTMRKPGENVERITKDPEQFPVALWQRYASPVWMDINPSRTLQFRPARESNDERHICPLQLDVIERGIELWSNPNDLIFSPFAGIGSEGYVAIQQGRQFVGSELKESYFKVACQNLDDAKREQGQLLDIEQECG